MDSANQIQSNTLFRPLPLNRFQNNLASHYQRTSEFVDEQFSELKSQTNNEKKNETLEVESTKTRDTRIRPAGLGKMVDMYI